MTRKEADGGILTAVIAVLSMLQLSCILVVQSNTCMWKQDTVEGAAESGASRDGVLHSRRILGVLKQ
jgi:hypothetical protein